MKNILKLLALGVVNWIITSLFGVFAVVTDDGVFMILLLTYFGYFILTYKD